MDANAKLLFYDWPVSSPSVEGGVPRHFFDPFSKQRACSQAILQSKPIAFLTFLLPSPSPLCKLPTTHPNRMCN